MIGFNISYLMVTQVFKTTDRESKRKRSHPRFLIVIICKVVGYSYLSQNHWEPVQVMHQISILCCSVFDIRNSINMAN